MPMDPIRLNKFKNEILNYLVTLPSQAETEIAVVKNDETDDITHMFADNPPLNPKMHAKLKDIFKKYPEAQVWLDDEETAYASAKDIKKNAQQELRLAFDEDKVTYQRLVKLANFANKSFGSEVRYDPDELMFYVQSRQDETFDDQDAMFGTMLYVKIKDVSNDLLELLRNLTKYPDYLDHPDD